MLLSNEGINQETKDEIKKSMKINENKNTSPNSLGHRESSSKGKVMATQASFTKKKKKSQQSNFTPKETRKRLNKAQS